VLAETELNINGTSFKGVYVAILLSLATTLGGGVWTASSLYGRLEAVEGIQVPDVSPINEKITLIEQQLDSNDVSQLQGRLAELGANLKTIMERQEKLLELKERIVEVEKLVTEMQVTVEKAELATEKADVITKKIDKLSKEVDNLWDGMDYLANPIGSN
jgi:DNA repair exonuclease SbcCD ATPase subunit